jgi:hypothetical protein
MPAPKESDDLMAQAIRAKVPISIVDARGVWSNPVFSGCKGDGLQAAAGAGFDPSWGKS